MNLDDRIGISTMEKSLRERIATFERQVFQLQKEILELKGENQRLKAMVK